MPRRASQYPTELELQILKILWKNGELSVREVRDELEEEFKTVLAHTSVVTTLNNMKAKRYLRRRQSQNMYRFRAGVAENQIRRGMVGDLVDRLFDGSVSALMLNLLRTCKISESERIQLQQMIDDSLKEPE